MTQLPIARRDILAVGGIAAAAIGLAAQSRPAHADTPPPAAGEVGGPDPATPGLKVVKVSSVGFDKADSTDFLQGALDSDADVVIVDKAADHWVTRPLFVRRSNVTVVFEHGTTVRALPGGFPRTSDALFTVQSSETAQISNVTISGYGATLAMNKPEYTAGEWRHTLSLKSVHNVLVEGLVLRDSGGDGVYLGMYAAGKTSRDVVIRDVTCVNNRRNGLSVTSADGLTVEGCTIRQTSGTGPDAGIDIEPNNATSVLRRIVIRDSVIEDNMIYGVVLALTNLDATSEPIDVTFDRVQIGGNNSQTPAFTFKGSADGDPGGTVTLRRCLVAKERAAGAVGSTDGGYGGQAPGHTFGTANGVLGVFAGSSRTRV